MNCLHCHKQISDDSKFCPYCGGENWSNPDKNPNKNILKKLSSVSFSLKTLLFLLVVGVWVLVFQNLGIIPVTQNVNIKEIEYGTQIGIRGSVDANLQYINGRSDVFFNNPSRGENDKYYVIPVSVE